MTVHVLNEFSHESLPSLLHNLSRSSYKETTRNPDGSLQKITIWTTVGKTLKIRETTFTRAGNGSISTVSKVQYDTSGAVVETLTTTLTRDGANRIASATVAKT